MRPLITLTTDFGVRDPYVAAMKGVLTTRCPDAVLLDLTHEIAPQDVREAAFFLASACPYFPAGTIHVVVIDPGVGTARRAIAADIRTQRFVCPDNGLLTFVARGETPYVHEITAPSFLREPLSATFHGRDVFAPAAAALASGKRVQDAGPNVDDMIRLAFPEPRREHTTLHGEVAHVDRFGNLITNISRDDLAAGAVRAIVAGGLRLDGLSATYGDVVPGQALALIGSTEFLELSVCQGSAARLFGLAVRTPVQVMF